MEIEVYRLREAMELLGPVVPGKPIHKVLSGFLIRDGRAAATDLEMAITVELSEAEGQCLLPYRPVAELLKRVRGRHVLTIEQDDKKVSLAWLDGKATFDTHLPDDYPPTLEIDEAIIEHTVDGNRLIPALLSVADYCSTDETRPVLQGVLLQFGKTTEVAAADGFRMAWQSLPLTFPEGMERVIIPVRAVRLLGHLLDKAPKTPPVTDSLIGLITARRELELKINEEMLQARLGKVSLVTRLIKGTFPDLKDIIDRETPVRLGVMASELERAVRQVAMVAREGNSSVRLAWADSTMTVSAESGDMGGVETSIPVHTESDPGRVAIDVKYLLGYLKGKDGLVHLKLSDAQSPVHFEYGRAPTVLLMPIFLEPEPEETPAEAENEENEPSVDEQTPPLQEPTKTRRKSRASK